jgi:hypothetical protein
MPITPLHFGAALPFQWALRERFSALAFVVANVAMDVQPVLALGFGVPVAVHGWTHTLLGASTIAAALTASAWRLPRRRAYALGFFVGTLSHVALDSCMHHDVAAFAPFREGNLLLARIDFNISLVMLPPSALWLLLTLWRMHRDGQQTPLPSWRERLLGM